MNLQRLNLLAGHDEGMRESRGASGKAADDFGGNRQALAGMRDIDGGDGVFALGTGLVLPGSDRIDTPMGLPFVENDGIRGEAVIQRSRVCAVAAFEVGRDGRRKRKRHFVLSRSWVCLHSGQLSDIEQERTRK